MRGIGWKHKARVLLVALATVSGLEGMAPEAKAFQFNNGDLVLAIFGNNTEFYYDIGTKSSLLSPGAQTTIDISALAGLPFSPGAGVVGGAQTQWTIIGRNQVAASPSANGIFVYAGSQNDSTNITILPGISATNTRIQGWNSSLNTSTGSTPVGPGAQVFLDSTDPAAFTNSNNFDLDGTLGGSWNAGGMKGSVGDLLNILEGRARNELGQTNVISDAGRAILLASGQLTICGGGGCSLAAVPLPAAVVLFGSGLIGLVGIARRKFTGITA
jgi:hypothetical protein